MKNIKIISNMLRIVATDSEEQTVIILRQHRDPKHKDYNKCAIITNLVGYSRPTVGTTTWQEAFADIQRILT